MPENHVGDAFDSPMQARARSADSETSELRGECPRVILNTLDAVAIAMGKGATRMSVANKILGEWAKQKQHEAMLVQRLTSGNPTPPESDGGHAS